MLRRPSTYGTHPVRDDQASTGTPLTKTPIERTALDFTGKRTEREETRYALHLYYYPLISNMYKRACHAAGSSIRQKHDLETTKLRVAPST
ncbi:unnamed protein product [Ectocarpus sp. 12 AP-2014]